MCITWHTKGSASKKLRIANCGINIIEGIP
jgi:hypothetical protein